MGDGPDPEEELARGRGLQHVAVGTGLEHPLHLRRVVDQGEHQQRRLGELLAEQGDRLGAVGVGEVDVGDDDVRIGLVGRAQRCARGAADDLEVGLLLRQGPQALTHEDAAVHEEQVDDVMSR